MVTCLPEEEEEEAAAVVEARLWSATDSPVGKCDEAG